jgi:hypothetical protein
VLPATIEKIGFFHFVNGFETPIDELCRAIEAERDNHPDRDIDNSLIVLPEAFNLGHDYNPSRDPELPASLIIDDLSRLAGAQLPVAFVVGILEGRCNSAYWVDSSGGYLMCRKMGDDRKDLYDPCTDPEVLNPIDCTNARGWRVDMHGRNA